MITWSGLLENPVTGIQFGGTAKTGMSVKKEEKGLVNNINNFPANFAPHTKSD